MTETIKGPNKIVNLEFGGQGHEDEYVLTLHKNLYAEAEDLPSEWEGEIKERLGEGWTVLNRGFRIEIAPPKLKHDEEQEQFVNQVVTDVFLGVKKTITRLNLLQFVVLR